MRRTILTALAVLAIGSASTGIVIAQAQPAPPDMGGTPPHQWMGGMHRGEGQQHGGMMHRLRNFALIYPQKDRKLTPPDVQKIAEGFLLWHGNHDWKVINVAPTTDGPIGFALATQDGSVIARFTMDPHTAKVERVS
jgi:hypothetical protein